MRRLARPLVYAGTIAVVLLLARFHAHREGYDLTNSFRFGWTIAYCGLLIVAAYGTGLPDLPRTRRQSLTSAAAAPVAGALGISVIQLATGSPRLPRFVIFGAVVFLVPWYVACVAVARGGRAQDERRDRVVFVGPPGEAHVLRDELDANPERPAVLLDALEVDGAAVKSPTAKPLVERVLASGGTVVVLDRTALAEPSIVAQAASLHEAGIRVRTLSLFYEDWLGKLPLSELERASLLFDIREVHGARYLRVKRMADIAFGAIGVLVLFLLEPLVAIGNLAGNRGPLIYRQMRVGKNGRQFEIWKFRTMRSVPDEELQGEWTAENDPRITPFGRVLRVTHLDELPQAWNILRGDLSIVGPRPEQPRYVEELSEKLPFYHLRHLVRPGLTGWAQVKYGYAGDERDALEKLQYEFWYLRHQTLALDLRIVGRTVRSVLGREGLGR